MRRAAFKGYKTEQSMPEEEFKKDSKEYIKQGWKLRTVYSKEDLKLIGKPYAPEGLLELSDGSLQVMHSSFALSHEEDVEKFAKQPWFGKLAVLKDGSVLNLDTENVIQKVDASEFEDITPLDMNYVDCFYHDWSAFDELGAIDESYHAIMREGITVVRSSKFIMCSYDNDNNIVLQPSRSTPITLAELDKKFEKLSVEKQFKETLETMKKLGISKEEIDQMTKYYEAYENSENEPEREE